MFEGNSLSAIYHLRDMDRQFTPHLSEFRGETPILKSHMAASLLGFMLVALSLGSACLI